MTSSNNEPHTPIDQVPNENNFENIQGFVQTVKEDPSSSGILSRPRQLSEQLVLVTNGGSTSAYFYDTSNQAWKHVLLT